MATINLHGSLPIVFIIKQTTLFQSNTTQVYHNSNWLPLHMCCMFQPVIRPSSGMSIQKSYKRRYNQTIQFNLITSFPKWNTAPFNMVIRISLRDYCVNMVKSIADILS
jgi:hypothetical protein